MSSRGQRLGVREVEAETVGRDQAALLGDMAAEPVAQRGVEQMGGADGWRGSAPRRSASTERWTASPTRTSPERIDRMMGVEPAERLRRVLDIGLEALVAG